MSCSLRLPRHRDMPDCTLDWACTSAAAPSARASAARASTFRKRIMGVSLRGWRVKRRRGASGEPATGKATPAPSLHPPRKSLNHNRLRRRHLVAAHAPLSTLCDTSRRVSTTARAGTRWLSLELERADGSPDRASGGVIDMLRCAPEIVERSVSCSKKFSWPPAAFHLPPVSEALTKDHASSTALPAPDTWESRPRPRRQRKRARENSVDSVNSV